MDNWHAKEFKADTSGCNFPRQNADQTASSKVKPEVVFLL
jgi:hypothetical protein